jgi:hypothetical protein
MMIRVPGGTDGPADGRGEIVEFARGLGIPPGVVVGRMQREGHLPWHVYNDLRRRFVLAEA